MSPSDMLRLDFSIEVYREDYEFLDRTFNLGNPVRFENVIRNYLLLQKHQEFLNRFNQEELTKK